jgi:hypothetical protein
VEIIMRWLIVFIGFVLTGPGNSALARDDINNNRFQSFVSVIGPVSVSPDQNLKLCLTDISLVTHSGSHNKGQRWSKQYDNGRSNNAPVVWSSTRIEVFDSTDTARPLPLNLADIVFSSGKGECINVPGYEMMADGLSRSVVIVLTTLTEARAVFDPAVSGQLTTPDNTSAVALLLPAVQSAPESPRSCCACAPVCGCGTCN